MNKQHLVPNEVYHIFTHATGEDNFFRSEENYRYFLQKYQEHIHPIAETYAYCLMPNHFHFMLRIRSEEDLSESLELSERSKPIEMFLSKQFANFFSAYTQAFNKMYDRRGTLFRERFGRKRVDDESYFTGLIAYIHYNPVKHGFTEGMQDWSWSSYHAFTDNKITKLQKFEVLEWFGGRNEFVKFHEDYKNSNQDYHLFESLEPSKRSNQRIEYHQMK